MILERKDCVYAPKLIASFLSAGRLNKSGKDIFLRRDGTCVVYDDDGVVATGQLKDGMYLTNFETNRTSTSKASLLLR